MPMPYIGRGILKPFTCFPITVVSESRLLPARGVDAGLGSLALSSSSSNIRRSISRAVSSPRSPALIYRLFRTAMVLHEVFWPAVEAALQVSKELTKRRKTVDDIKEIVIRTQEAAMEIINKQGLLHNAADRDHCL